MSKKILIVLGTRPEIIKLAPLILMLKDSSLKHDFTVASTSQHEELLDEQLDYWQITPDYFLTSSPFKGNLVRLLSHTLSGLQDIIDQVGTIEYILVQGDTNTSLACANLAFLNQLKLIHVEAGLRTFDLRNPFPEEFNRNIASKVAYFHFAPTELSKTNLMNEGVDPSKIMVIGNTVIDALRHVTNHTRTGTEEKRNLVLITLHRRENIEKNYLVLVDTVYELANKHPELKFIWITHPNCLNEIREGMPPLQNIEIHHHIPYNDFVSLYGSAKMIITDSGGVSEEAIHLGLPVIIFRLKTERIEAVDVNYPMIVTIKKQEIISFFNTALDQPNTAHYSYGNGNASLQIMNWLSDEIEAGSYDTVIIGGGPAGTGLLLKTLKDGPANPFFEKRIALIEKSSDLIKGTITQYDINSDTFSDVFLECLDGSTGAFINTNEIQAEIEAIRAFKGKAIPLKSLENYYNKLGALLKEHLESTGKSRFFMESPVTEVILNDNGTYRVFMAGKKQPLITKSLIIATGGRPNHLTQNSLFNKTFPLDQFSGKFVHSDSLLKSGVPEDLKTALFKKPNIVIVGGSHSAFSAAHLLLHSKENYNFGSGNIKIWCRSLPKVYFPTKEDALENGYSDFTDHDFCPVTKKLYRLAGLRMDGRTLYMNMLGLNQVDTEKRLSLKLFTDQQQDLESDLHKATIIILAFGYKLNLFPFYNEQQDPILFKGEETGHWVNQHCEMLDANGFVIPNLYASGLATGFIPGGKLGGEPSFEGQTNGIWYYQNAIAEEIITRLQDKKLSAV
jgi:UDP-N-acetylglucosamine 2-epimerase (non-hydrolysing)